MVGRAPTEDGSEALRGGNEGAMNDRSEIPRKPLSLGFPTRLASIPPTPGPKPNSITPTLRDEEFRGVWDGRVM